MRILRSALALALFISSWTLLGAQPADAGVNELAVTKYEIGYDLPGNSCAAPQSAITVAAGANVEICYDMEAEWDLAIESAVIYGVSLASLPNVPVFSSSGSLGSQFQTTGSKLVNSDDLFGGFQFYFEVIGNSGNVKVVTSDLQGAGDFNLAFDSKNVALVLDFAAPTLTKTVSTDGTCGAQNTATVITNTAVTYCYSIVNPSSTVAIGIHYLDDDKLGTNLVGAPHIWSDTTFTHLETQPLVETVTNAATACVQWFIPKEIEATSVSGSNGCESDVITATATVTVEDPNPSIAVTATVGTTDGVCATETNIAVDLGTDVYFCYTATNDGNVPFDMHTVADTLNGTLLTDKAHDLAPGDSVTSVALGATSSTAVTGDVTTTVTWTATGTTPELPLPDKLVASATVTAEATADAGVTANPEVLDELAFTGNETGPLTIAGIAALFAGIILLAATRRREN